MVHGLMGSLTMMEKVLNDVLSFNRMESGKVRYRELKSLFFVDADDTLSLDVEEYFRTRLMAVRSSSKTVRIP